MQNYFGFFVSTPIRICLFRTDIFVYRCAYLRAWMSTFLGERFESIRWGSTAYEQDYYDYCYYFGVKVFCIDRDRACGKGEFVRASLHPV